MVRSKTIAARRSAIIAGGARRASVRGNQGVVSMGMRVTFLAAGLAGMVAACSPSTSGPPASGSSGIEQDIAASRSAGPVSARPGAAQADHRALLAPAEPPAAPAKAPPQAPIVAGGAFGAQQTVPGDAKRGRQFALDNCRPCHVVARDQSSSVRFANAPDFQTIANMPQTTPVGLNVWLTNPHPTMPTLVLSQAEATDVIAYIMSLQGKR
jgi:mono/diheme cytochrome c family protein